MAQTLTQEDLDAIAALFAGKVAMLANDGTDQLTLRRLSIETEVEGEDAVYIRSLTGGGAVITAQGTDMVGLSISAPDGIGVELAGAFEGGTGLNVHPPTVGIRLDLTQPVPTTNSPETVGDALNAGRAQGFGKWAIDGTTLTLYAEDGTTPVRTFTLDSAEAPTSRTPAE